jgi:tripartite-type tricarboxylate transporter receptor subunit TctC
MQRLATTPEQMAQRIRDDIERWGPLIKTLGVTLD